MTVRVVIADDNPVVRVGLTALLSLDEEVEVVGEAVNGADALAMVAALRPDAALLDVRMPVSDGLSVLTEMTAHCPVLMLTHSAESDVVAAALRLGATGYLVHGSFSAEELAAAVVDTAASRMRLSPEAAAVAASTLRQPANQPTNQPGIPRARGAAAVSPDLLERRGVSRRETEILELLVQGLSNQQIARRLFIEPKTVKNHVNRIFAKLGVTSRPQAIAVSLGIQDVDG
jgi:DNA-binding NarL/FixJ family response regulator